jgi:diketogulonate reductase-like aldo/keto reductase
MQRLQHVARAIEPLSAALVAAGKISSNRLDLSTTIQLRDGLTMPLFGLGTWRAESGGECREACDAALEMGYNMLDTASGYNNEEDVGAAIQESSRAREDIYVVTKHSGDHGYDATLVALDE